MGQEVALRGRLLGTEIRDIRPVFHRSRRRRFLCRLLFRCLLRFLFRPVLSHNGRHRIRQNGSLSCSDGRELFLCRGFFCRSHCLYLCLKGRPCPGIRPGYHFRSCIGRCLRFIRSRHRRRNFSCCPCFNFFLYCHAVRLFRQCCLFLCCLFDCLVRIRLCFRFLGCNIFRRFRFHIRRRSIFRRFRFRFRRHSIFRRFRFRFRRLRCLCRTLFFWGLRFEGVLLVQLVDLLLQEVVHSGKYLRRLRPVHLFLRCPGAFLFRFRPRNDRRLPVLQIRIGSRMGKGALRDFSDDMPGVSRHKGDRNVRPVRRQLRHDIAARNPADLIAGRLFCCLGFRGRRIFRRRRLLCRNLSLCRRRLIAENRLIFRRRLFRRLLHDLVPHDVLGAFAIFQAGSRVGQLPHDGIRFLDGRGLFVFQLLPVRHLQGLVGRPAGLFPFGHDV